MSRFTKSGLPSNLERFNNARNGTCASIFFRRGSVIPDMNAGYETHWAINPVKNISRRSAEYIYFGKKRLELIDMA